MRRSLIKTAAEIAAIRKAGGVVARVLREAALQVRPGLTTRELDHQVGEIIRKHNATSAFYRYRDFPRQCCISVNEEVIHGLGGDRRLQFGDLVKLDIGVRYQGMIGDAAMSLACGGCGPLAQKLIDVTNEALYKGISAAKAGNSVADIGRMVQGWIEGHGFGVVREFCGHGVGRAVHEDPQIPNYDDQARGSVRLRAGMTIAIEPMVTAGNPAVEILPDRWTVVTRDRQWAAHFEHTVLITNGEAEILTRDESPDLY